MIGTTLDIIMHLAKSSLLFAALAFGSMPCQSQSAEPSSKYQELATQLESMKWKLVRNDAKVVIEASPEIVLFGTGGKGNVTQKDIELLAQLKTLKSLTLNLVTVSDDAIDAMVKLETLESLNVGDLALSDEEKLQKQLRFSRILSKLRSLKRLSSSFDHFLRICKPLPPLVQLSLFGKCSNEELRNLSQIDSSLRILDLRCLDLSPGYAREILGLTNLEEIGLKASFLETSGDDLARICDRFPTVQRLEFVQGDSIGDGDGFLKLCNLKRLNRLSIDHFPAAKKQISASGFERLKGIQALRHIELHYFHFTTEEMQAVGHLTQLETLDLDSSCKTIQNKDLLFLAECRRLEKVSLKGAENISPAGIAKLKSALPSISAVNWP